MFFGATAPVLVALARYARAGCVSVTVAEWRGSCVGLVASGFFWDLVVVLQRPVESSGMGQVTKKALDAAQHKFLAAHAAEIEAMAVIEEIQERRDKLDVDHDARARELDMELGHAVASARESMPAKKVAATLGVSEHRQKKLLDLLDTRATPDTTPDSAPSTTAEATTDSDGLTV